MGRALKLVAGELRSPMSDRALPPVLVLISDGQPTDDFGKGLEDPWASPGARRPCGWPSPSGTTPTWRSCAASSPTRRSTPCRPTTPRPWCATSVGLYRRAASGVVPGQPGGPPGARRGVSPLGASASEDAVRVSEWRHSGRCASGTQVPPPRCWPGRRAPGPAARARPRPTSGGQDLPPPPLAPAPPAPRPRAAPHGPRWRVVGTSVRGAAHRRRGLPNQDALRWWPATARAPAGRRRGGRARQRALLPQRRGGPPGGRDRPGRPQTLCASSPR